MAGSPLVNLSSNGDDLAVGDLRDGALEQFAFTRTWAPCSVRHRRSRAGAACSSSIRPRCALVTLSHNEIFVDNTDFSDAFTFTAYFDIINEVAPGLTLKNQTFYDLLDHTKFSTYGSAPTTAPG